MCAHIKSSCSQLLLLSPLLSPPHCHDNRHRSSFIASVRTLFLRWNLAVLPSVFNAHSNSSTSFNSDSSRSSGNGSSSTNNNRECFFCKLTTIVCKKKYSHRSYVRNEFCEEKKRREKRNRKNVCVFVCVAYTHWLHTIQTHTHTLMVVHSHRNSQTYNKFILNTKFSGTQQQRLPSVDERNEKRENRFFSLRFEHWKREKKRNLEICNTQRVWKLSERPLFQIRNVAFLSHLSSKWQPFESSAVILGDFFPSRFVLLLPFCHIQSH